MQGMRQEAFLYSVGIGYDVPVTVLSDGGEDVGAAASLGVRCERILDWFHIGMRFQHLQLALQGLRGLDSYDQQRLRREAIGAKWFLWHGNADRCLARLASLRRETGWVGKSNVLGKLILYLERGKPLLTNYAARRAQWSGRAQLQTLVHAFDSDSRNGNEALKSDSNHRKCPPVLLTPRLAERLRA